MSTAATVSFRWLDILEKEFDKSFLDLEKVTRGAAEEYDLLETSEVMRRLLSNLGQCFVQLVHKSQTIFQTNAKLEAELLHLREELSVAQATLCRTESEKKYLICCLQSTLIENHKLRASNSKDGSNFSHDQSQDNNLLCESIQMRLDKEMSTIQRVDWDKKRLEERCNLLEEENITMRRQRVELESELVGARLDAKYLDKELAGRIQQIQILLASNTTHEHKQRVWSQIEASMHLQRSKTIANMCFSKQKVRDSARSSQGHPESGVTSTGTLVAPHTSQSHAQENGSVSFTNNGVDDASKSSQENGSRSPTGRFKQVLFHKHDTEDLGIAILGGHEYGLPIMISEIFPDSAVSRCAKISAGDILLSVNGDPFGELNHNEAVKYLSALRGSIRFDLENTIEADIDDVCDTGTHLYDFFDGNLQDSAKRNPPERLFLKHPGKAKPAEPKKSPQTGNLTSPQELPKVHSVSPRKAAQNHTSTS